MRLSFCLASISVRLSWIISDELHREPARARQHPLPLPAFVLVAFTACNESFLPFHKPAEAREAAPNIYRFGVWQIILMPSDPLTVKRGFLLLWSGQIESVTPAAGTFPGFLGASKQFHNILHGHHSGRLRGFFFFRRAPLTVMSKVLRSAIAAAVEPQREILSLVWSFNYFNITLGKHLWFFTIN